MSRIAFRVAPLFVAATVTGNVAWVDAARAQGVDVARSQGVISAITTAEHDGIAELNIATDRKVEFSLFRLTGPTRIVIDIADADIGAATVPSRFADSSVFAAVTTTQFRGKTSPVGRVVVVLRGEAEIDTRNTATGVVLSVKSAAQRPTAVTAAVAKDVPVIELVGAEGPAAHAMHLLGVEASDNDGGSVVHLKTDGELGRYEVEEAQDPARLIVDLYGVDAHEGKMQFSGGVIARARVGKHEQKVRVVLDAPHGLPKYDVASTGEGLAIAFASGAASTPTASVDMRGLTFDKRNGFWRLKLDLGGAVVVRTVKNGPDEKVIALDGVRAASKWLTTRAGDGPISAIDVSVDETKRDSVRVRLSLAGPVEHSVWQRDGAVFWDIRESAAPATVASNAQRVQPSAAPFSSGTLTLAQEGMTAATFKGKKITIDIMEGDIVNVIRLIGEASGKNVVVSEDVKGKVTIKLKNVPWDQALDVILKTKDLGQETRGGIIRVVPQAKLDAEREARLKLREDLEKKLPTTVRLIPVNYAVATELIAQVKGLLSKDRGTVTADVRTNVLIVEDIRDNLDQAERLVRTLDTQTPQVLIEARMVVGSTTFTRDLGIQWGGGLFFSQRGGNPTGLAFPNNVGLAGAADRDATTPGVAFPSNFAVNLPASDVTSGVGLNLGSIGNFGFLNARLTAAETNGQAKVVSAPRVTTLNNTKAHISQGEQFSFSTVTANAVAVSTVEANLELDVTPHVTADGSVLMHVNITNNTPNFERANGGATPPISTREAETELLVRDGDTAVIGGIYTRATSEGYRQTPFLGSIPILGWLFKASHEDDSRVEMLVFVTPRIINRRSQGGT